MTVAVSNNNNNNNSHDDYQYLLCGFVLSVAVKVLLFPSYRSTDFDVHRHWKALTRSLPSVSEWYFDDQHVSTVHTLDYPPAFGFFEYFWSTNPITNWLIHHAYLDKACLALESSDNRSLQQLENGYQDPSTACIAFMRSTVIVSDVVLWMGAWMIASAVTAATVTDAASTCRRSIKWTVFGLIVANPAFLWIDSVHFQYNGFLLGILLLSLACLVRGNDCHATASTSSTTTTRHDATFYFHFYHLTAAVLFAWLLTLKHLYMTLAFWYFAYLLRRYCFVEQATSSSSSSSSPSMVAFRPMRFLILGVVTLTTLVIPFLPFVVSSTTPTATTGQDRTAKEQLTRILQRLFPFGRGLVHDYWAGNLWALYMAMTKVLPFLQAYEPSPNQVVLFLFLTLLPGALVAWRAAAMASKAHVATFKSQQSPKVESLETTRTRTVANELLWSSFTYTSMGAFMTAYHVHEKAILTTLIPMTIWLCLDGDNNKRDDGVLHEHAAAARGWLLWRTMAFGLLGLFPLLFRPTELLLKVFTFTAYLTVLYQRVLVPFQQQQPLVTQSVPSLNEPSPNAAWMMQRISALFSSPIQLYIILPLMGTVVFILECIPLRYFGRFEFVPLALCSLVTAMGISISFLQVTWRMMQLLLRSTNTSNHKQEKEKER